MIPTPNTFASPVQFSSNATLTPQAERLSLQQEAQGLLEQIDQAYGLLDGIMSTPVASQSNTPPLPLTAAIQEARARMNALNTRLSMLSELIGTL